MVCQEDFPPVIKRILLEIISNSKGTTADVIGEYNLAIQKELQEQMNKLSALSKVRRLFTKNDITKHYLLVVVNKKDIFDKKICDKEKHITIGKVHEKALRFYPGFLFRNGFLFFNINIKPW